MAQRLTSLPRPQLVIAGALAALTVAAWLVTAAQTQLAAGSMAMPSAPGMDGMGGMAGMGGMSDAMPEAMPGSGMSGAMPGDTAPAGSATGPAGSGLMAGGWPAFAVFLPMWITMMVAMMFPAATPMILLFDRLARQRKARGQAYVPTAIFVAGYLVAWAVFGVIAYLAILAVQTLTAQLAGSLPQLPLIGLVAILFLAGIYQLSPLKTVCLRHCQTPFGFVVQHWREGTGGAFAMGLHHGTYCIGCCWGLMLVLIAVGLMNLAAMGVLALVIFVEKVSRRGFLISRLVGLALIALALWHAVQPALG